MYCTTIRGGRRTSTNKKKRATARRRGEGGKDVGEDVPELATGTLATTGGKRGRGDVSGVAQTKSPSAGEIVVKRTNVTLFI